MLNYSVGKVEKFVSNPTKLAAVSTKILKSGELIFLRYFVPCAPPRPKPEKQNKRPELKNPDLEYSDDEESKSKDENVLSV
jgi:hypothetical protein